MLRVTGMKRVRPTFVGGAIRGRCEQWAGRLDTMTSLTCPWLLPSRMVTTGMGIADLTNLVVDSGTCLALVGEVTLVVVELCQLEADLVD